MENSKVNHELVVYGVKDLMAILGVGRSTAYELMRSNDFPSFLVGKLWRVSKVAFENWLANKSA